MQKDTWVIIGVIVTLVGLLATFMVTSLTSIESRLTAMDNRLAAMDGRLHEMNTRLSRIEGHLRLPAEVEPIQFETMDEVIIFKEDGRLVLEPVARSLPPGIVFKRLRSRCVGGGGLATGAAGVVAADLALARLEEEAALVPAAMASGSA